MVQELGDERREYFRVNDNIYLDYIAISEEDAEESGQQLILLCDSADSKQVQLKLVESTFSSFLNEVEKKDELIAGAVKNIDENLNLLRHAIQGDYTEFSNTQPIDANLSGGGLACLIPEKIPSNTAVEVRIKLRPSGINVHAITRVISCREIQTAPENTPFYLRLKFTHLHEGDRQLLIEHTLAMHKEMA